MKACPYCHTKMDDGYCRNPECEHCTGKPHSNHILLAIPSKSVQGLRVGDLATDILKTIKEAWIDKFGPFCPGSGREKDAQAITRELEDRLSVARVVQKVHVEDMADHVTQNRTSSI